MAKRLLIVEDDDAIARLLEDNLRYDGFIAERAGTVNEALRALEDRKSTRLNSSH